MKVCSDFYSNTKLNESSDMAKRRAILSFPYALIESYEKVLQIKIYEKESITIICFR